MGDVTKVVIVIEKTKNPNVNRESLTEAQYLKFKMLTGVVLLGRPKVRQRVVSSILQNKVRQEARRDSHRVNSHLFSEQVGTKKQ